MLGDSGSDDLFDIPQTTNSENNVISKNSGNGIFGFNQGEVDLYSSPPPPEVTETQNVAVKQWETTKNQELAAKDKEESEKYDKMVSKASTDLAQYKKKITESQEVRAQHNKEIEDQNTEVTQSKPENKWEEVVSFIDFNRSDLHKKDVSRMKSLLLQLKH